MRRSIVITFTVSLMFTSSAYSADLFAPAWRGDDFTTFSLWDFDTDANPAFPNSFDNDFGDAQTVITVGAMGTAWWDYPGEGTIYGMWDIGAEDGSIAVSVDTPISTAATEYTDVSLQFTWFNYMGNDLPPIAIAGGDMLSSQEEFIESDSMGSSWYLHQSSWKVEPSVTELSVLITGHEKGTMIEQVIVDTRLVPEPATLVIMVLGTVATLTRRKK